MKESSRRYIEEMKPILPDGEIKSFIEDFEAVDEELRQTKIGLHKLVTELEELKASHK